MKEKWNIWLPLAIMVVFAFTRWPGLMPANFSAAYAIAFCAGAYFPPKIRWWLPLGTLLVCDVLLNIYYGASFFDPYIVVKLIAFGLLIWLGKTISQRASWIKLTGGGLLGACIFYLVTNFASWLYDPAYPRTLAGLIQALTVGTPGFPHTWEFFRNTLLSGGLFTGLFCGAMKLGEAEEAESEQEEEEEIAEPSSEEAPAQN